MLSWNNFKANALSAKVIGYELYAFHLASSVDNKEWKKIGDGTHLAIAFYLFTFVSVRLFLLI